MLGWIFVFLGGLVAYFVYDNKMKYAYWKAKGIPSPTMWPLLSALPDMAKLGQGLFDQKWTAKLGRIYGYFDGPTPVLITSDPDMLKHVMVKDCFSHFLNRRDFDIHGEVLEKAVTVLRDQHWKDVRGVLVPTFTSAKLRQMHPLILESCENMVNKLNKLAGSGEEFEAKGLFAQVTLDVIATTFFGTRIDSINSPDSAFVKHATGTFNEARNNLFLLAFLCPQILPYMRKIGLQYWPKHHVDFFVQNTEEIIRLRKASNQRRKDFLQTIIDLQDKTAHPSENKNRARAQPNTETEVDIVSDFLSTGKAAEQIHSSAEYKTSSEELIAQAVAFFMAGFETTATTLGFIAYCLATNPHVQDRLREETEIVMQGKRDADYEDLAQMEYLDQCINEALRLYPAISRAERECTEDWEYKGLKVNKGTVVSVPIYGIQRDTEYWPDPEVYDPERFSKENRHLIKPYTFWAFGQGPRNCIGMRFALYEIKMVMTSLIRKFRILPCSRTQVPLKLKDVGFVSAKDGVWVKLVKI